MFIIPGCEFLCVLGGNGVLNSMTLLFSCFLMCVTRTHFMSGSLILQLYFLINGRRNPGSESPLTVSKTKGLSIFNPLVPLWIGPLFVRSL